MNSLFDVFVNSCIETHLNSLQKLCWMCENWAHCTTLQTANVSKHYLSAIKQIQERQWNNSINHFLTSHCVSFSTVSLSVHKDCSCAKWIFKVTISKVLSIPLTPFITPSTMGLPSTSNISRVWVSGPKTWSVSKKSRVHECFFEVN